METKEGGRRVPKKTAGKRTQQKRIKIHAIDGGLTHTNQTAGNQSPANEAEWPKAI